MRPVLTHQIADGPLVIGSPTRAFRTAALALFIKVGARDDAGGQIGISHFLEHALFRGSARYTDLEIASWPEERGGSLNAYTSEECTCLHVQIAPERGLEALDFLFELAARPRLTRAAIEKEREILLDEARMNADQPLSLLADLFSTAVWGNHPLGKDLGGNLRSLRGLNQTQIAAHHARHYRPENLIITYSGDLDFDAFCQSVVARSRDWPKPSGPSARRRPAHWGGQRDRFRRKALEQVHWQIGTRRRLEGDRERCALTLISAILGETMSSRLFQQVREKSGLAYLINSDCSHFSDASALSILAVTSAANSSQCVEVALRVLRELEQLPIDERELMRAKRYCRGGLYQELDHPTGTALWLGEHHLEGWSGDLIIPENFAELISSIDLPAVGQLSSDLLDTTNWFGAFLGPGCGRASDFSRWRSGFKPDIAVA